MVVVSSVERAGAIRRRKGWRGLSWLTAVCLATGLFSGSVAADVKLTMLQAVPNPDNSDQLFVAFLATGADAGTTEVDVTIITTNSCSEDALVDGDTRFFADVTVEVNANGNGYFTALVNNDNEVPRRRFVAAEYQRPDQPSILSRCIVAQRDNDSWVRAAEVDLEENYGSIFGYEFGYIDKPGNQRWYKVPVQPGSRLQISLDGGEVGLERDYDVFVFRDIGQAFNELTSDEDVDSLRRLGAEFAPSIFSPSIFSPSIFSPSIFSPDAYAPSIFSPSIFSPSIFSPSIFSPSIFSPSAYSPSIFSPSIFSPSIFSPSIFSSAEFNPSIFSPSIFSAENFVSAQTRSLIAVAATRGRGPERLVVDTWQNTGFFYVLVTGKNGQFDNRLGFNLGFEVDGVSCEGVMPIAGSVVADAGDHQSLILWDSGRLDMTEPGNSEPEIQALATAMTALAERPEVQGHIVDLADIAYVQALQEQADNAPACPYAANLVAQGIRQVIKAYRELNPGLRYIVLAGSDNQIPFFRYPDQALLGPEQDYDPPVADGTHSQSALRLNYVLGQDEYGSNTTLLLGDSRFPVPKLAVGRLVESAAEMTTVINAYLGTAQGVVDTPTSTLVTGYDFLTDAATGVNNELVAGTLDARNDALLVAADISPADPRSWTADDLRRELLVDREDIVYLAGHFSANSTLAADYTTSMLSTELDASPIDMTNVIVFSGGCHSGYNLVGEHAVELLSEPRDWTQAFAAKGATLIAGTGYQYGDTDFVEYSERLYVEFARELRAGTGPVAVGEALVRAKQRYLAETPDVRGLHRKSVIIATLFGLPMIKVDMPGERVDPTPGGPSNIVTSQVATNPGATLGLQTAPLNINLAGQLADQIVELTNLAGGTLTATYVQGPDGVTTYPAEPALPLVTENVSVPNFALRGVGFRGGSWIEREVVPLTGAPTTELRGVHTPFVSTVNYPLRLFNANYFGALAGGSTLLHITPAQHRVANVGDITATQRQFGDMSFELFYSKNTQTYGSNTPALAGPPTFTNVRAVVDGPDVIFQARVVGDPAAGIQKVWVTFSDGASGAGSWISLDMQQSPQDSTVWDALLPNGANAFGRLEFIVQAVNGVGLVAMDDNFGEYYKLSGAEDGTGPDGTPLQRDNAFFQSLDVDPRGERPFGSSVELTARLADQDDQPVAGASVLFTLGSSGRVGITDDVGEATVTLPLTVRPGDYRITATFAGDEMLEPATWISSIRVEKTSTQMEDLSVDPTVEPDGVRTGIGVRLTDAEGRPLLQRTVYFTVSGAAGEFTAPVITDHLGRAGLGKRNLPTGEYAVTARFLGDVPGFTEPRSDPVYEAVVFDRELIITPAIELEPMIRCVSNAEAGGTLLMTADFAPGTPFERIPPFLAVAQLGGLEFPVLELLPKTQGSYVQASGQLSFSGVPRAARHAVGVDADGNAVDSPRRLRCGRSRRR